MPTTNDLVSPLSTMLFKAVKTMLPNMPSAKLIVMRRELNVLAETVGPADLRMHAELLRMFDSTIEKRLVFESAAKSLASAKLGVKAAATV
jgi:hypothetical protein